MLDLAILIRLMRELQYARPVCDALLDTRDTREVLLIVGARARNEWRLAANSLVYHGTHRFHEQRLRRGHRRMNDEQVLQFIPKLGVFGAQRLDQIDELFPNIFELLFYQKTPVEYCSTQIRHARRLRRIRIL